MNKLNPSIKHHLLIGVFIGIWIFCFVYFIRPFEIETSSNTNWAGLGIGFSFLTFLCYGIVAVIQNKVYKKILRWNVAFEMVTILCLCLILNIVFYKYSKSSIINSVYNFSFFSFLFAKTSIVLVPLLIFSRLYVVRLIPPKETQLTIRGDNKLDILKVYPSELISASSSQNYVEIFYLDGGELSSKLIRSSLKKLHQEIPFLVQVHRSHFINPTHFKSWKNQNTIYLTQMEISVSKNFKDIILSL
ncbi:LytTR family DNA-binding domain-containing protein [Aquimarina spongiae]|uniref:Transcriptional regulator, LytTR family n=1 Tax=Aquimarina spongiae TaxID=570521 RepID=A0A1M6DX13_9FLAO|nr:LytTR family DNA-binding domain-containing protein [Aquimarina spongiae]SHI77786.1 transcriptional regulator, LytTR family [Aquimarina spongiae]